jgi:predicted permease
MKKYFPYLILISALFISITGSFFSIYGLGKLFGGHQVGATILAFAFEFGNIVTATALKYYWKYLPPILKYPLILIVITLTILTSMGIYGYLSDGYQKTALKDEIVTKRSNLVKTKKQTFETRVQDNKNEISLISNNLTELSKGYNQNTQTQQVIKGQVVTNVLVSNKKGLEQQMNVLNQRKYKLDSLNSMYLDSIQKLELSIIEIENSNETNSELGPLKYLSSLTGKPMNEIVNWLILLIVIVFQPLALMLILTSMFAFKNNHYLNRTSKRNSSKSTLNFKALFEKLKSKIKPKQNQPQTQSSSEPQISPTIDSIPEVDVEVKPKRKRNQRQKNEVISNSVSVEETKPNEEVLPVEESDTTKSRRRVVDTQLTPDIADHISKSLGNKKKV